MVHVNQSASQTPTPSRGLTGCFLELAWGLGGFAALVIVGVLILKEDAWTLTAKDAVYWGIVIAMPVLRFANERQQVLGQSVPLQPIVRFAATLVPTAGVGWVLAQSFSV